MDRKSIIVLAVCFVLLLLWFPLMRKMYPPKPLPPDATNRLAQVTRTNGGPDLNTNTPPSQPATEPSATSTPASSPVLTGPESLLMVTNGAVRYTFTSRGGGLKQIDLLEYPERATPGHGTLETNGVTSLNEGSPHPVLELTGDPAVRGDGAYTLRQTDTGVEARTELPSGLVVVKEFEFASNYIFTASVRFENPGSAAVSLPEHELIVGTSTPLNPHDNGMAQGVLWFNGEKSADITSRWFANRTLGCFPGTPREEFLRREGNVVWAAAHNQFFALAAMPETNGLGLIIRKLDLPRPSPAELATDRRLRKNPQAFPLSLIQPALSLGPGESATTRFTFYGGPKEYRRLARLANEMGNEVDLVMGYRGFFGFFAKALLLSMNWLHDTFKAPYGLAIVLITVIIKAAFWPLTQASTRSMKRMQALQPQMKALQEKYKDDPAKMNKKLMEFMREHKVSPLGGCLPMLLQIPVFFGFFRMIRSAIELRGARFLWVKDLSQPDTLFMIPGVNFPFNLLPLIMGSTMLWQARLQPVSPGMDPTQQKIMKYMPLMFLVILYNYSAGLTLYWTVQNLLTILQMRLTKAKNPDEPAPPTAPKPAPVRPAIPMSSKKKRRQKRK